MANYGPLYFQKSLSDLVPAYGLKSGREKCLKAGYGAKGHGRRDRAKKEESQGYAQGGGERLGNLRYSHIRFGA